MASPIRQLLSQTSYDGDGTTTVWNFNFAGSYLDQSHVKAQTLNKLSGAITQIPLVPGNFLGPNQLTITPPVAIGQELTIYRDTPKDLPLVDFIDNANLSDAALDTNAKQAIFAAAEITDTVATSLDAVNEVSNQVQNAVDAAAAAAGSATAANNSAIAAAASAVTANTRAGDANNSAIAAAASAASIAGGPVASIAGLTGIVTSTAAKAAMALDNVNNTSDANKPVSTAQAAADATKYPSTANPSFRNLIINGDGRVNYADTIASGASSATGNYFTNRWRSTAAGVVSWTTGASGKRVFTVSAAGVEQVVEGARYNHGGVHTLSWVGTATATVNGAAITNGGQTAVLAIGANITVKFVSGTFTDVQLERGPTATAFENRDIQTEDALCQRYAPCVLGGSVVDDLATGFANTATSGYVVIYFRVPARVTPANVVGSGGASLTTFASNGPLTAVALSSGGTFSCRLICTAASASYTPGHGAFLYATSAATKFLFTGCEL